MFDSDRTFPLVDGFDRETPARPPVPALPALPCVVKRIRSPEWLGPRTLRYCAPEGGWTFDDVYASRFVGGTLLLRNAVFHAGDVFSVDSVSRRALTDCSISALCISRNVASLGENCSEECDDLQIVVFEGDSHLAEISADAFDGCLSLRSIAIPRLVDRLWPRCFRDCQSLQSVMFETPSKLATIDEYAFCACKSLTWFSLPASVTAMDGSAFYFGRIRAIEIGEGSVSFRVVNEFLVDFEVRSLVWVIGSPESIVIPSSIEALGRCCCACQRGLRTIVFESDSTLRSISKAAFTGCFLLESICIPSSVEVLLEYCFDACTAL
jgi:hypothetical protein